MLSKHEKKLAATQDQQKLWYNQNARDGSFQAGDLVMVLKPVKNHKLEGARSGSSQVLEKQGPMNLFGGLVWNWTEITIVPLKYAETLCVQGQHAFQFYCFKCTELGWPVGLRTA